MNKDLFRDQRERLIRYLVAEGYIKSDKVRKAMEKVPRESFVLPQYRQYAYVDTPLPIGYNQTISAPHMVALMTERLDLKEGELVLEVGTGSGYQAAIIAEIIDPLSKGVGHVVTIEIVKELAEFARENLMKTGYDDRVSVIIGDGSIGTFIDRELYDKIIITAASPKIPRKLISQLKPGGIMVVPVGSIWSQTLYIVKKIDVEKIKVIEDIPCVFVPLKGREGFKELKEL
ncbi:MAG: protein-L-isoaspartate(D-aspartate) O-methyltransferase [Sulfolobales archaeon]